MSFDTMIVAVFDNEEDVYKGMSAAAGLHRSGDIAVYSYAVIARDADGGIEVKKAASDSGNASVLGLGIGGLIGLLAGPAGAVAGATAGLLIGSWRDLATAGVDARFMEDVALELEPGRFAIIAEIQEGWQTPLDVAIGEHGGKVLRRPRVDVIDAQLEREAAAAEAEWQALEEEAARASAERKEKISASLAAARARAEKLRERVQTRVEQTGSEAKAKIAFLRAQAEKANADMKTRYNARVAEIEAGLEKTRASTAAALDKLKAIAA